MSLPTDTRFADQWHLRNTAPGQFDLNVLQAWNAGYTGEGVRVFVLDDGFDINHVDISPNYNPAGQFDYEQDDANPIPRFPEDNHGTACMGIIGAARNGTGAVGVAYDVQLTGIRGYSDDFQSTGTIDDYVLDLGRGILRAANAGGDVISMSNGYASGGSFFGTFLSEAAVDFCVARIVEAAETGRDGLGLIMVKAAGNSREEFWNINMSEVDNNPHIISVAAVDRFGNVDDYSSYGGNILVAGFGSPGEVVTTDRTGPGGYEGGNITTGFNGTSAATPMVAGVVALMLDANARLGWRDVQDILAASARVVGSGVNGDEATPTGFELDMWVANRSGLWNGGGFMYSNDYGFGLVDAGAAVRLAETWFLSHGAVAGTSANDEVLTRDILNAPRAIPDNDANGIAISTTISGGAAARFDIDYTTVTITMGPSHTYMENLAIVLENSTGDQAVLHLEEGGAVDFPGTWTFTTRQFHGETAAGTWTLRVADFVGGDTGTLTDVVIRHHGDSGSINDRHIVTDQFATFAAEAGRRLIEDTDGGIDTLFAAPLSTGINVTLNRNVGSMIDGTSARVDASIENVIGGLGNDRITGSGQANLLSGQHGNDQLFGAVGNDRLLGGLGNDSLSGGIGNDRLDGGRGADVLTGGPGNDVFVFSTGHGQDRITDFTAFGAGQDRLDLSGLAAVTNFVDLVNNHLRVSGSDVLVIAGTDVLRIEDVTRAELSAADFIL